MFLRDITFTVDGNADRLENGALNLEKMYLLGYQISELLKYQKTPYVLPLVEECHVTSLQALHVVEEDVLHGMSLRCEPVKHDRKEKEATTDTKDTERSPSREVTHIESDRPESQKDKVVVAELLDELKRRSPRFAPHSASTVRVNPESSPSSPDKCVRTTPSIMKTFQVVNSVSTPDIYRTPHTPDKVRGGRAQTYSSKKGSKSDRE